MSKGSTMTLSFPGGVAVDAIWKGHVIRTDQPAREGGDDAQPSPFDLFLASIATCVGFYVVQFCRSREIDTTGLGVEMSLSRSAEKKLIETVSIEITLPRGFPEKYRKAVLRSADQCTVKRHLLEPPEITLELRDAGR
jgi:putative redox protein